ncbi:hypothetical protein SAMN05877753_10925 [Bacillus oleivorans]|uniref:Endonuclease/exonuclease/phosphatase family protein n=1 Tax=Bacillus oleivorans TaxID=1448271 RepID=A0A285D3D1_9BACI|nr:hypothetical protein [Bacillus oleivorans]SNX74324.1 hypothetical protein SAMN05877753_10925 [Bacillus oleivorans]
MININILFWNIKNNIKTVPAISYLCKERKINILILSEANRIDSEIIVNSLKKIDFNFTVELPMPSNRTLLFHNIGKRINKYHDGTFYSLFKLKFRNSLLLLASLHLPSMLHNSENEIGAQAAQIKREIEIYEEDLKTDKTMVVGDFNLNPFSELMVSAYGFNAIMDKDIALKIHRTIYNTKYKYFYNPMWTLHGNINNEVLGTYFYHNKPTSYIWNMFDQVLIRPSLMEHFNFNDLEIISRIGEKSLLRDNGRPNSALYSDHLPLKFSIF